MDEELETRVLKAVSRSFYLSLRLLPAAMRRGAAVGYLLARSSDTLADSAEISLEWRMEMLEDFSRQLSGEGEVKPWPRGLIAGLGDGGEAELLRRHEEVMGAFFSLREGEGELVREVVETITGGQKLDLEKFGKAEPGRVVALADDDALDDYTWRVAGCVGVFWTKLGYLTLGEGFSRCAEEVLLADAVEYGKALQLVNILRDLPEDLRGGRCYLPVDEPRDRAAVMGEFERWRGVAEGKIAHGFSYSQRLAGRRLRLSSSLPAKIAKETLQGLEGITFGKLEEGFKLPRKRIYLMILGGLVGV